VLSKELLEILVCPETKQQVKLADESLLEELNGRIASGELKNRNGEVVAEPLEAGLVRADGAVLYPVRDDIPVMLVEEAIPLSEP
jgi:uncharacterized protein YbaR (Trm112 family)